MNKVDIILQQVRLIISLGFSRQQIDVSTDNKPAMLNIHNGDFSTTSLHNRHCSVFSIIVLWSFHYKLQTLEQTFCGIKSQGLIILKIQVKTAAEA